MSRTDFASPGSLLCECTVSAAAAVGHGFASCTKSATLVGASHPRADRFRSGVRRRAIDLIAISMACIFCVWSTACATLTDARLASYRNDKLVEEYRYTLGEKYIDLDGLKLCYQEYGEGEVLLILPGLGTSADFWQLTIPALAKHYRVIAVDLPGFGKSDKPPDASYELLWICDKILAFLDAKGIETTHVMGGSLGGHIGLLLALDHPARIKKLIMVGACGAWPVPGILIQIVFHTAWQDWLVSDHLRRNWPKTYRRLFVQQTPMTERIFRYQMAIRSVASLFAAEGRASTQSLKSIFNTSCRHRLVDVTQPVLLVWGEDDFIHPPTDGAFLRKHLPNSRFVVVREAAHGVMIDQPDVFNRLVLRFLNHGNAAIEDDY